MPLTITLKKNEDFYVGDQQVVLQTITPNELIFMSGTSEFIVGVGEHFDVHGARVAPRKIGQELSYAKVSIEAPEYKVLRGKLYRETEENERGITAK